MQIRPAREEDIPAIQAVGAAAWRDTYIGLVPDGYIEFGIAYFWSHDIFVQTLKMAHGRLYVADNAGHIVGVIRLSYTDDGTATLWQLYLLKEWRGQGCGRALWEAVTATLPSGIQVYKTSVVRGNRALHFYERLGFVVTHAGDPELQGYRVSLFYLERRVGADVGEATL